MISHSRTAQVACQELMRLHLDEAASDMTGSIEARHRNGRVYLDNRFRIGTEMKSRYLGEETPALRSQLDRAAALKAEAAPRRQAMARLARTLRAEGFLTPDRDTRSLLLAFARASVFRLGGTLVGTGAYGLYQGDLGVRFVADERAEVEPLSISLGDRLEDEPSDILQSLKFAPVPELQERQVWKWRQSRGEALVEFLTPAFGAEEVKPLPALGVSAQGLHYLDYLIADPIPAVALYRSGVLVQVPRPERYAIDKLIVAERRRGGPDQGKARKDRAQAAFLIDVLAQDRPDDLAEAYAEAQSHGPRWRERIAATLALMPKSRETLERL